MCCTRALSAPSSPFSTPRPPYAASVSTSYQHVLLAVVDKNVYLSADTRAAVAAAGAHALSSAAKLTVLLADAEMLAGDANTRLDTVRFHLGESGYGEDPGFLTETGAKTETAIADAADSVGADLVVLSASAAHVRAVDLNLLAEFLSQPLLLIP